MTPNTASAKNEELTAWTPVTGPGQVQVGHKLRFTIGDKSYSEKAKLILHAGTDKEEVIYDKGRNFYFITAMVISGFSNHKNVEYLSRATLQQRQAPALSPCDSAHADLGFPCICAEHEAEESQQAEAAPTAKDRLREKNPGFAAHLDKCSAEVATWPTWKGGKGEAAPVASAEPVAEIYWDSDATWKLNMLCEPVLKEGQRMKLFERAQFAPAPADDGPLWKRCRNKMIADGVRAIPKSCPACGLNKHCARTALPQLAAPAPVAAGAAWTFPTFEDWLASDIEPPSIDLTPRQTQIAYAKLAFNAGRASPAAHPANAELPTADEAWSLAAHECGTVLLSEYRGPVIVLERPSDVLDLVQAVATLPPAQAGKDEAEGYVGTISAGEYDPVTGAMYVTVKLPFEGLPEELRTLNARAVLSVPSPTAADTLNAEGKS